MEIQDSPHLKEIELLLAGARSDMAPVEWVRIEQNIARLRS